MTRTLPILCLLALASAASPNPAGTPDRSAHVVLLRRCAIEFDRKCVLGATGSLQGFLQDCNVRPGDRVKAGQVLGRIQDRELQAELDLHKAEAESDIEIRLSQAKFEQAKAKLDATEALKRRDPSYVSRETYILDVREKKTAELEVEEARYRHRLAQIRCRQAEALVHEHEFVSPFDGTVVAVLKNQGESVNNGEPIFKVVNTERVRLVGELDVLDAWRVHKGQAVRVAPEIPGVELPIHGEAFEGKVILVESQIDPETRTCKVLAEVANRNDLLRAGIEASMEIQLDTTVGRVPSEKQQ